MRRSASSIPTNIAEGCGRSDREFARFLGIAIGSANELDYQVILSKDLDYTSESEYREISDKVSEIQKMLAALVRKIRSTGLESKAHPAHPVLANS
jgi:four helix bundle protein